MFTKKKVSGCQSTVPPDNPRSKGLPISAKSDAKSHIVNMENIFKGPVYCIVQYTFSNREESFKLKPCASCISLSASN